MIYSFVFMFYKSLLLDHKILCCLFAFFIAVGNNCDEMGTAQITTESVSSLIRCLQFIGTNSVDLSWNVYLEGGGLEYLNVHSYYS